MAASRDERYSRDFPSVIVGAFAGACRYGFALHAVTHDWLDEGDAALAEI